jgi:hypothetical protein
MTREMRFVGLIVVAGAFVSIAGVSGTGRPLSSGGVRLVASPGWQEVNPADAGSVTDPQTLLVVGTPGVRPRPSQCQIAAYRIPPVGAAVVVVGWKNLALSGARHRKPGRWPLKKLTAVRRPSFECFNGRGAAADLVLQGKAYQVNVLVGDQASTRRVQDALATARSFDFVR